jgi:hypothetical protein
VGGKEMTNIDELRAEAKKLMADDKSSLVMRSCWHCNPAHEHLKNEEGVVIMCFGCGKWFYKGQDITDYTEDEIADCCGVQTHGD